MKNIIFLSVALIVSSCTTLKPSDCNYEYGYAKGINAANAGIQMSTNLDHEGVCSNEGLTQLQKGYREGYTIALKSRPDNTNITVNNVTDSTASRRRNKPQWECISDYGRKVCGYNCVSSYGDIKCAKSPREACISAYGQIKCGKNCRSDFGQIVCD